MQVRPAVLPGVRQPFSVEEVKLDPPRSGEVLLKLVATGVCHSDVHVYTGDNARRPFPIILGHEGAGVVQEVGEGVTDCRPGDHVVLTFLPACGRCRWCHTGHPNMCDLGALRKGGTMTVAGVGASRIAELPIAPRTLTNYRKKVQGVLFGEAQFRWDVPKYVRLYEEGRIDLDGTITRELRLEGINAAVQNILAENRVGRQVIRFG